MAPALLLGSEALIAAPIEDTTRREFIIGVGSATLAAAFFAACGDDDAGAAPDANDDDVRVIEHMYGTTEVRGTPSRVVTVGWTEQDAVLALGVVPVATTEWIGEYPGAILPWAQDRLGDAEPPEVLSDADGIQFERTAALQPDLILALYVPFGLTEEDYDRLSQIAPTIAPPAGVPDGGISWQDLTRTVGRALGQEETAAALVEDVEALFSGARDAHPEFVGALGINAYPAGDGSFQAYPPPDPGGRLMEELGFKVPPEIEELAAGAAWVDISGERVSLFDIDVVLWLVEDDAARDRLLSNPTYTGLNVASEGRHVFLAYDGPTSTMASATSMQTVLSLPYLLEHLVPMLAAAIDGDPATEPPL